MTSANRVKTGEALSAAFEAQTGIPVMYTTTLLAGERSGNLQEVLERYISFQTRLAHLSQEAHRLAHLSRRSCSRLSAACSIFMFTVVIPQFAQLYDQMGSKLPTADRRASQLWQVDAAQHPLDRADRSG